MLLLLVSLFFACLAWREVRNARASVQGFDRVSKVYLGFCLGLAVLSAWTPLKKLHFESFLSDRATQLAQREASVHCNSAFNAMFDNAIGVIGHANPHTGDIVFQLSWCEQLMDYLDAPHTANTRERYSLMLFTHEVMHIRGELNEQKTECQAIQRNHLAGELLGISREIAALHTLEYFEREYLRHPYFSEHCRPGGPLDEQLIGSAWYLQ
ncbi:MAG: hypothetical protein ACPG4U_01845 [Pseudomonadales bacterium]